MTSYLKLNMAQQKCQLQYNISWHMKKLLNVPLRFRFLRFAAKWESSPTGTSGEVDELAPVRELDGWALREEFFRLPRERAAYVDFLNKVGLWFASPRHGFVVAPPFEASIWILRDEMRRALKDPVKFIAFYTRTLNLGSKGLKWPVGTARFELDGKVPILVIETTGFYELLVTTICADLIQGFKFRFCARKDCAMPFAVETAHGRKFCCQYCGHLESVRLGRGY